MDKGNAMLTDSVSQPRRVEIVQSSGSDQELDALFDASVLSKVKPLRDRGLPPSFFQQPDQTARSSTGSSSSSNSGVMHSRTVSLPVSLQDSFSVALVNQQSNASTFDGYPSLMQCGNPNFTQSPSQIQMQCQTVTESNGASAVPFTNVSSGNASQFQFAATARHGRQSSWDIPSQAAPNACQVVPNSVPVPMQMQVSLSAGPNGAAQMTFERCKCVEQPFEILSLERLLPTSRIYTTHGSPIISDELLTLTDFGRLLPGWQFELTADRQLYFVDHTCQRTTWCHPRIPIEQQRNVPFVVVSKQSYATMLAELERRQREQQAAAVAAPPLPPRDRLRQAQLGADQHVALHPRRRQAAAEQAVGRPQLVHASTQLHSRTRSECYAGWQSTTEHVDYTPTGNELSQVTEVPVALQPTVVHARSASYPAHSLVDSNMALLGDQLQHAVMPQQFVAVPNSHAHANWSGAVRAGGSQNQLAPANAMTLSQHSQLANSPSSLASSSPAHQLTASSSMEFHARQESNDSGLNSVPHTMPHTPEDSLAAASTGRESLCAKTAATCDVSNTRFDFAPLDMSEMSATDFGLMTLHDNALGFAASGPAAMSWSATY